ncbi:MAG: histidinol-phosphate transaminase [Saccharofermentans sp.]|nr:histidinol-phosphate transaminase [Saccharofermentans sp.]
MSKYWNKLINDIEPYVAGEQPKPGQKVIKLNTNENPYAPSPKVKEALADFDLSTLRLYPDTNSTDVIRAAAKFDGVGEENIFCGNGSDEVLAICFQTFFEKKALTGLPVLMPEFSYSFYPVFSEFYDIRRKAIPLKEDFRLDPDDYIGVPNCGIVFANPNAPTTRAIAVADCARIAAANPDSVVIVDEAYVAFEEKYETAVSLIKEYKNVCVVRTLSKAFSLAGIRLGYAVADAELIEGLKRARDSFNSYPVDRLAQKVAEAALLDVDYYEETRKKIIGTRGRVEAELKKLGFTMPPSSSNFLFAKPPMDCGTLYQNLRSKGILVRYFNKPVLCDYLRITIGTDEEMDELLDAIRQEVQNAENS